MLRLEMIQKKYRKKTVITDYSATFGAGVHVITGPSGAGKTTLLRLCASQEKPTSGSIVWQGDAIRKNLRSFRAGLGYAPQIIDYPEDLSSLDFMLHIGAIKGLSFKALEEQARALLQRLGLGEAMDRQIASYSGGMRRRLGVAQAFLGSPSILILDEPTAELDQATAARVNDLIFEEAQTRVVLMTTHLEDSLKAYTYTPHPIAASHGLGE